MTAHNTNPFTRNFEHRDDLLDGALEEFAAKGYDKASINDILSGAGMSKGQFYHHFGSKEALYLSLIGVLIEQKQAFLISVMSPLDMQQEVFAILKMQAQYGFEFARKYPAINGFAASFLREKGSPIYRTALQHYNFLDNDAFGPLLDLAIRRGELRDDLPPEFIKRTIGYLFTHAAEIAGSEQVETFEPFLDHLITFMQSGLGRRAE